jgi:membrane protein implicated in regulation of membrane protease activity
MQVAMLWLWFALAGLAVVAELFTGTFYLLLISLGLAAGGFAAWAGADWPVQLLSAAAVAAAAFVPLHRSRWGQRKPPINAKQDASIHLDIGQRVRVDTWEAEGRARVTYRGAEWDVELAAGEAVTPGRFEILEMRGNQLILTAKHKV